MRGLKVILALCPQLALSFVMFPGSINETNGVQTKKIVLTEDENTSLQNETLAKAQASVTRESCECQCIDYTFRQGNNTYGNCLEEYKDALWCYVRDFGRSTCLDKKESSRVNGLYWSYQACSTPRYQDCLGMINDNEYDYYDEEDGLPDIGEFLRSNLRGDGSEDNEEKVTFNDSPTSLEQIGRDSVLFEESGP
ncbi:uncharacterized protein LOC131882303 isoform X2 [Tigriopus californicus]|uniref:uncharacterized protein LOC131882303 isoform X2 n=1 Tax=Tigriopus californicus TaxID=6832 RepID=UPI0027DA4101|nr:uncharacterized protein LOC131882303 isoform X2 [Tigriopus californicus]